MSMRYSKPINDKASHVMGIAISVVIPQQDTNTFIQQTIKSKNLSL